MRTHIPLKRLAQIRYGLGQPPPLSDDGVPILRATNIARGKVIGKDLLRARTADLPLDRAPLLEEGEILVVRSGAYTGDSARITREWAGSAPGYDLRVTPLQIDSRYLAHALLSTPVQDQINLASSRAAQPHLNAEELGEVLLWVPSLEEQRRIADFLDVETSRIDRLTSLRCRQAALLASRRMTRLSELFRALTSQFGEIRLRHLLTRIEQGWSPQCEDRTAGDGEWGVIKAGCVNTGHFDQLQHKALPVGMQPRREYKLKVGDLLMSRASGSPDLIGSIGVVRELSGNLLLCDKIYRLRLDQTRVRAEFVAHMLRSHQSREHIKNGISGAEGMANNLPTGIVKDCTLPKISIALQEQIVSELDQNAEDTDRARVALERSIKLLSKRREALVSAAVTGQFDVTTARREFAA